MSPRSSIRLVQAAGVVMLLGTLTACSGSDPESSADSTPTVAASASAESRGDEGRASSQAPTTALTQAVDQQTLAAGVAAAQAFYDSLDAETQEATLFDYADLDGKQGSWSNFPVGIFDGRQGARMGDLSEDQRAAALAALKTLLSAAGYEYLQGQIAGEDALAAGEGDSPFGSDNYYVALFGAPSVDQPWTLQFGGHHLAIHISLGGQTLSVSPYFQGIQPITFEVDGTTVEPMKADADDMFGLFESLSDDQLASAELAGSYDDLVMGPGADTGFPEAEGLAYTDLSAESQELVGQIIEDWVADAAPGIAQPLVDVYRAQLDDITVGWSGSISRDGDAYMRLNGPRLWVEWVNTSAGGGEHYHTIYRDKLIDYGTGSAE